MQWESGQLGGTRESTVGQQLWAYAARTWTQQKELIKTKIETIEVLKELTSVRFVGVKMMEATDFIHSTIHRYGNLIDDSVSEMC